jgi:hypothetical protein
MHLPADGVQYATVTFTEYPEGATVVEASLDRATWWPFDLPPVRQADGTWEGKVLLRGPDAASSDGHPVTATTALWVRVTDTPEVLPLRAGLVTLS